MTARVAASCVANKNSDAICALFAVGPEVVATVREAFDPIAHALGCRLPNSSSRQATIKWPLESQNFNTANDLQ